MKHALVFILLIFMLLYPKMESYGQCIANAGKDTSFCIYFGTEAFIGGSPAVTGGTPPYTYTWSANFSLPPLQFTASSFLDDTTAANPKLVEYLFDTLAFVLTVKDSLRYTCHDTVVIRLCKYIYISTGEDKIYIDQGDTTSIGVINGGCPPFSFQWSPNYNISNTSVANPRVWPDTTTFYSAIITDAAGCESTGTYKVYVTPTGINEPKDQKPDVDIYPNPMNRNATIQISGELLNDLRIAIFDNLGRKLKEINIADNKTILQLNDMPSGIYFYQVIDINRSIRQGKLVVQ